MLEGESRGGGAKELGPLWRGFFFFFLFFLPFPVKRNTTFTAVRERKEEEEEELGASPSTHKFTPRAL